MLSELRAKSVSITIWRKHDQTSRVQEPLEESGSKSFGWLKPGARFFKFVKRSICGNRNKDPIGIVDGSRFALDSKRGCRPIAQASLGLQARLEDVHFHIGERLPRIGLDLMPATGRNDYHIPWLYPVGFGTLGFA